MMSFFGPRTRYQECLPDMNLHTLTVTPEELVTLASVTGRNYYRPWIESLMRTPSRISSPPNKFQVNLDVQHFSPDELTVKALDGYLIVEGKHEEKKDEHGWVSRQFTRRYELPRGCNIHAVQSRLSSDGVLTIDAPLDTLGPNERVVPITHTGPVRTENKESKFDIAGPAGEAPLGLSAGQTASVVVPVANGQ